MPVEAAALVRGDRLLLSDASPADEVASFARGAGFEQGRENDTPHGSEHVWIIRSGLFFHHVEHAKADVRYVQVTGDDRADVQQFTWLAGEFFTTVGDNELLSDVRAARTAEERARALTRLAVGLPSEPREDGIRAVLEGFDANDPTVRRAALLSALYLDWEHVGRRVRKMAEHDDAESLRLQANYFVDRHDRSTGR
ncbi:hypothetical protein OU415_32155 [Saccharopolyspora sp. WRP15-2]|uniref:HEAT repeat domain-containing protein n=1 Tax=Saccharopolyspora oryzae TaxID=2997343 RepID=A0ABT4V819_9PSEU|nr:hypothetical protein [Saccharopolyspora oryzae]MDA3630120.1 hypothetical protein [Saccharopolyspora oryzae]